MENLWKNISNMENLWKKTAERKLYGKHLEEHE
jgi:hypothetical protein